MSNLKRYVQNSNASFEDYEDIFNTDQSQDIVESENDYTPPVQEDLQNIAEGLEAYGKLISQVRTERERVSVGIGLRMINKQLGTDTVSMEDFDKTSLIVSLEEAKKTIAERIKGIFKWIWDKLVWIVEKVMASFAKIGEGFAWIRDKLKAHRGRLASGEVEVEDAENSAVVVDADAIAEDISNNNGKETVETIKEFEEKLIKTNLTLEKAVTIIEENIDKPEEEININDIEEVTGELKEQVLNLKTLPDKVIAISKGNEPKPNRKEKRRLEKLDKQYQKQERNKARYAKRKEKASSNENYSDSNYRYRYSIEEEGGGLTVKADKASASNDNIEKAKNSFEKTTIKTTKGKIWEAVKKYSKMAVGAIIAVPFYSLITALAAVAGAVGLVIATVSIIGRTVMNVFRWIVGLFSSKDKK